MPLDFLKKPIISNIRYWSKIQIDRTLNTDLLEHKKKMGPVLENIQNLKSEDFSNSEALKETLFFYFNSKDFQSTPIGQTVVKNLKIKNPDLPYSSSIEEFSNNTHLVWSKVNCIFDKTLHSSKEEAIAYMFEIKNNSNMKLMPYINSISSSSSRDSIIDVLHQKFIYSDVPYLIEIYTRLDIAGPLTTIVSYYPLMLITGPAFFFTHFYILGNPQDLQYIIKSCLYKQQSLSNLGIYKPFINLLTYSVIPISFFFFSSVFNPNLITPNSLPIKDGTNSLTQIGNSLLTIGKDAVPTMEKNPLHYFFRERVKSITFAIVDIGLHGMQGIYQAYLANIYEISQIIIKKEGKN